jgi:sugar phosphate isomerase/epimerase
VTFRYAICNETFEGWDHAQVCRTVADLGYQGLEIAPFTLAPRIGEVSAEKRRTLRRQAEECGLKVIGLHWLLAKTEGFHLNSADAGVRRRTAEYLGELAHCCRDLGGDLMVFGSPGQRRVPVGATRSEATNWAAEAFRQAAPVFADCGVNLCVEPLAPAETDFITTVEEGLDLIRRIDHPNFKLHLDVKAMSAESRPIPELVRRYGGQAGHFHANDANRRGPGFGDTDFKPIFRALKDSAYQGWVSVEVFDYTPDPVTIARESIAYMREQAGSGSDA